LDAPTDPRFGRCEYFVLVDTETREAKAVENTAALQGSGAGIAAVQLIANAGADAVIAGNLGPNAFQTLAAGGIKAYGYEGGTVRQAVEALQAGKLAEIGAATVPSHFGMGAGGGRGRDGNPPGRPAQTQAQEAQLHDLRRQLDVLESRPESGD
jgi:predicted Fe-Mo cluster-binding NifX family protein